jgi:hypothetical protein
MGTLGVESRIPAEIDRTERRRLIGGGPVRADLVGSGWRREKKEKAESRSYDTEHRIPPNVLETRDRAGSYHSESAARTRIRDRAG